MSCFDNQFKDIHIQVNKLLKDTSHMTKKSHDTQMLTAYSLQLI